MPLIFRSELISKILSGKKTTTIRPAPAKYKVGTIYAVKNNPYRPPICWVKIISAISTRERD